MRGTSPLRKISRKYNCLVSVCLRCVETQKKKSVPCLDSLLVQKTVMRETKTNPCSNHLWPKNRLLSFTYYAGGHIHKSQFGFQARLHCAAAQPDTTTQGPFSEVHWLHKAQGYSQWSHPSVHLLFDLHTYLHTASSGSVAL